MATFVYSEPVVAIDGPSGVGKGTTAKLVAQELGVPYLDTGSIYRAITWRCLMSEADLADPEQCGKLAAETDMVFEGGSVAYVDGMEVRADIRGWLVTAKVSKVCAHPTVRAALLQLQRDFVTGAGGVVEGRDIGSVVLPNAPLKVYLTASNEVRAARAASRDELDDVDAVARDILRRDLLDSSRAAAPLMAAPDAVIIDNSTFSIDETVARVIELAHKRGMI